MAKKASNVPDGMQRINLQLPDETIEKIDQTAARLGTTKTFAIRRAVSMSWHIDDLIAKGGTVAVEMPDGSIEKIIFI